MQPKSKNRAKTQAKLISAVGEVLAEQGFAGLGVNAVAKHAGVDKVLIYRYFGNFDDLCLAYARSQDFWPSIEEIIPDEHLFLQLSLAERLSFFGHGYLKALRKRTLTLEALAWETVQRNSFTAELETVREEFGLRSTELMSKNLAADDLSGEIDAAAVGAIFSGWCHYLLVRSRKIRWFNGIDISSDEGWARLEATFEKMVKNLSRNKQ
ncbi:MAG: TetR/AcrR family transcriptional regulator [Pseudomonadota bacterium]